MGGKYAAQTYGRFYVFRFPSGLVVASFLLLGQEPAEAQDRNTQTLDLAATALAVQIGKIEKNAQLCGAPPSTYSAVLSDARHQASLLYARSKFSQPQLQEDIQLGREIAQSAWKHQPALFPNCNAFRRTVSALKNRLGHDHGRRAALAPYDTPGWQLRVHTALSRPG